MSALILFVTLLQPAATAPVASILPAGAIEITAQPDHLVLGDGTTATLTVRVYDDKGRPDDQLPPTLLTSVGTIEKVRRSAPGVFEAKYIPPAAGSPRVSIILARVRTKRGLMAGWSRVPLWGRGKVAVSTKPASQVLLRIGDSAFGPVESDSDGRAVIPIKVPPGPSRGVAETLDRAGNTSKKTIDLGIKPFDRLAAFGLDEDVVADGSERSGLVAFAVDGRGVPLVDAPLSSSARHGAVGDTLPLAPGVYRIAYRAPSRVGDGSDEVTVELQHDRISRVQVPVTLTTGDPAVISLAVEPDSYRAGSDVTPMLSLHALDAAGNSAPASLINVTTTGAVLGVAITDETGGVKIPIEIDNRFGSRESVVIEAQAQRGDATANAEIALVAGRCVRIEVEGPDNLYCDGRSQIYTARCVDRFENSANFEAPRVAASPLIVEQVESEAQGSIRLHMRTPVLDKPKSAALTVRTPETAGLLRVQLLPSVWLHSEIGPRLVGGWNYGDTWLAGGALDWHLAYPLGTESLLFGVSIGALTTPPLARSPNGAAALRRLQIVPLLLEGGYQGSISRRWSWRAGLGLGPVFGAQTVDIAGRTLDRELAIALTAEASAGIGYRLGRGRIEFSLRGGYGLPLNDLDQSAQLGGLWASLGYRLPM